MTVQERIQICRLIEMMDGQKSFAKEIGLENTSKLRKTENTLIINVEDQDYQFLRERR